MTGTADGALKVLDEMHVHPGGLSVMEVARLLGQHRTTAYRLLSSMEAAGYLCRPDHGSRYRLSLRVVELAGAILECLPIHRVARPHLLDLRDRTGEGVHLGILDGGDVVYLERIDALQPIRFYAYVGSRFPAHASGIGKVLLAHLPDEECRRLVAQRPLVRFTARTITDQAVLEAHLMDVRRLGYAVADEEYRVEYRSIAVPVPGPSGRGLAGISVSGPAYRLPVEALERFVPALRDAAGKVARALGLRPAPV